jgi:hypothetical protein
VIEMKLACDAAMVLFKQGRLNGKTEQEVGERAKEARKVERSRGGGTGAKIRKLKKCRPSLNASRVVDVRLNVNYGMNLSLRNGHLTV